MKKVEEFAFVFSVALALLSLVTGAIVMQFDFVGVARSFWSAIRDDQEFHGELLLLALAMGLAVYHKWWLPRRQYRRYRQLIKGTSYWR